MNLQTVITNLKTTIAGKERLYQSYCSDKDYASMAEVYVINAKLEFIQINIAELKAILKDVEVCAEQNIHLHQQLRAASWLINPDRSGGQFTQDEINSVGE